jgi:hypothetical protein
LLAQHQPPPDQILAPDQLDGLVSPIALYPDPLLGQVLVASTYPLELVQAYQWLQRNPGLAGSALTQAIDQQQWDPSIQALVVFPEVIKRLNQDVRWTTNLGKAFLDQQPAVMDAVQRMRLRAQQAGRLQSTSGGPSLYYPYVQWYYPPRWALGGAYFGFGAVGVDGADGVGNPGGPTIPRL